MKASNASSIAINAAAEASAICFVNLTCNELGSQYHKSTNLIEVANKANQQVQASVNTTLDAVNNVKQLLNPKNLTSEDLLNAGISQYCSNIAQQIQEQAQLSANATASAIAQCSIILNLTCYTCSKRISDYYPIIIPQEDTDYCKAK
jgi:hypothetical protein